VQSFQSCEAGYASYTLKRTLHTPTPTPPPCAPVLVDKGVWSNEPIQACVKGGVLQAVPCDECEEAVESQHAFKAPLVQGMCQEVTQQQRAGHGGQHV
jgi:hypothetical protein